MRIILLFLLFLFISLSPAFTFQDIFVKAGIGGVYNFDEISQDLGLKAGLLSEFKAGWDSWKFYINGSGDYTLFDTFQSYNITGNGGFAYISDSDTVIKISANGFIYSYSMDGYSFIVDIKQDIFDFITLNGMINHAYSRQFTTTNEDRSDWGVSIDAGFEMGDTVVLHTLFDYRQLNFIDETGIWLTNDSISLGLLMNLELAMNLTLDASYKAAYFDSHKTGIYIPASTNSYYLFNTAIVHQAALDLTWDINLNLKTVLGINYDLSIISTDMTEQHLSLSFIIDYFISPEWKVEIPLTYFYDEVPLSGPNNHIRLEIGINYLI